MPVRSVLCEIPNGLLLVADAAGGEVPDFVPDVPVLSTESGTLVVCLHLVDGQTRVTIGADGEIDPGRVPVHKQMLLTPKHLVQVENVDREVVVAHPVVGARTRVRIWTNHPVWADGIVIGVSQRTVASCCGELRVSVAFEWRNGKNQKKRNIRYDS